MAVAVRSLLRETTPFILLLACGWCSHRRPTACRNAACNAACRLAQTIVFDRPVRIKPGAARGFYIHSALPDDLGIQYRSCSASEVVSVAAAAAAAAAGIGIGVAAGGPIHPPLPKHLHQHLHLHQHQHQHVHVIKGEKDLPREGARREGGRGLLATLVCAAAAEVAHTWQR